MQESSIVSSKADEKPRKLPPNVRVMIGIVASPTLIIIAFSVYAVLFGNWRDPGIGGVIFSALGLFAYFVVIAGRLPRWFSFKKHGSVSKD